MCGTSTVFGAYLDHEPQQTCMLDFSKSSSMYALLRVRLESSLSRMKPSLQIFSFTIMRPSSFRPSLARSNMVCTSMSVRYSRHHCIQMQSYLERRQE